MTNISKRSLKRLIAVFPVACVLAFTAPSGVFAGPDGADASLDGHKKIQVHARYPGDKITRGDYRNKHYVERCNWFTKGSFWYGESPLGLTQGCARIDVPRDMSDYRN